MMIGRTRNRAKWLLAALALTMAIPAQAIPDRVVTYIVYFDWDRDTLSPEAIAVLDAAIEQSRTRAAQCLTLTGHTDRSRSETYNVGLSRRMAESVRSYLTSRGMADASITVVARGETELAVPTNDDVRMDENRRVEVAIADC